MENKYEKFTVILASLFIIIFTGIFIFSKKLDFSENENRYLAEFPEFSRNNILDASYTEGITTYLTDHFPYRDSFVSLKSYIELLLGKKENNNVFVSKDDYLIENYNYPNFDNINKIIDTINSFKETLNDKKVSLMLIPTSITINSDKLPKYVETYSQLETIDSIYKKTNTNNIKVYDYLKEGNKEYQMYYRLDHHWTTYGAYYGYLAFSHNNNIEPLTMDAFNIEIVSNDFKGTVYSKSNYYFAKPDEIALFIPKDNPTYQVNYVNSNRTTDTLYEKSYLDKKDKYAMFLDNLHPLIVITNENVSNKEEIVVIKDSYANNFIPFLVNHYHKVHVIDPRFYKNKISEYMDNNNINECLLLYNMNTLETDLGITSIR